MVEPEPVHAPKRAAGEPGQSARGVAFRGRRAISGWPHLSHELRTPLNAIQGNLELLLAGTAGSLSAEARTCLGDAQAASRQLMREVGRLLLLAQVLVAPTPAPGSRFDLTALRAVTRPSCHPDPQQDRASAGGSLLVLGDPVWLDVLAGELVEIRRRAPGGTAPEMQRVPQADSRQVRFELRWREFDLNQISAVALALIDAILALHDGHLDHQADGLCLIWPSVRVLSA